jgi:hypothetical protein
MEDAMRLNHLAKLSGALIFTAGLAGNASANNYGSNLTPHEACKTDETRGKFIGGSLGAVAGAVLGSQVAGNGARTEASVIGGLLGGLAGAGIADKRVDCDPVYPNGEAYSSGSYETTPTRTVTTLPTTTVYGSSPTYSTTTAPHYSETQYSQAQYGTRTTVSDHPVYANPTYGAQPVRSYVSQPISQPSYTPSNYSPPQTYQTASYSQPRVISSATTYSEQPISYSPPRTSYTQPRTSYVQPVNSIGAHRDRSRRYGHHGSFHHHGKYSCSDRH